MSYDDSIVNRAKKLRQGGLPVKRIATQLNISPNTAWRWVNNISLSAKTLRRLQRDQEAGRQKALQTIALNRNQVKLNILNQAIRSVTETKYDQNSLKIMCSLLFWGEGSKRDLKSVSFINSDPLMIRTFITLLKGAYLIDPKKLRCLVHLHEYHDKEKIKKFWSKVTGVPLDQFNKCYIKSNTSKTVREGYMGACRIRYYDYRVAQELLAIYNTLANHLNRGVSQW
jgi:hypothetical protein